MAWMKDEQTLVILFDLPGKTTDEKFGIRMDCLPTLNNADPEEELSDANFHEWN